MSGSREFVLTLSCRDANGIVDAVSGPLLDGGCHSVLSARAMRRHLEHRVQINGRKTVVFE